MPALQSSLSTSAGFNKLKGLGQLQLSHMWRIKIFKPIGVSTVSGEEFDMFSVTARTFELPALTRQKIKMRMNDREYTVPGGQTSEHEFSIEVVNDEGNKVFDIIYRWYTEIPDIVSNKSLADSKTNAIFALLSMDGKTVKKVFEIQGIYPMDVPQLGGWNQDSDAEHSKFTCKFAFDDVIYKDSSYASLLEKNRID